MLQWEHSAILSTFIKLLSVIKIFVLSIFEWLLKIGFTVHTRKSEWFIVYIEGSQVIISKTYSIFSQKFDFVLANSTGPGEMLHYASFHLCFHCLPWYTFKGFLEFQSLNG